MTKYLAAASRWLLNAIIAVATLIINAARRLHDWCLQRVERAAEAKVHPAWCRYMTALDAIAGMKAEAAYSYAEYDRLVDLADTTIKAATVERYEVGIL